jgi:hypothetical protein
MVELEMANEYGFGITTEVPRSNGDLNDKLLARIKL